MKQPSLIACIALLFIGLTGCQQAAMKKTKGGMPYQLFTSSNQKQVKMGEFLKLSITQKINDSVVFSNQGKIPNYIPVMSQTTSYDLSEVWSLLRTGDSVVATQMMDTFINRSPGTVPPPFKKGDRIITTVKVLGIFANDSLRLIDMNKELDAFKAREIREVEAFVKKSGSPAQRTKNGIFVQIIQVGNGNLIDSGKYVSVNYTGMTFDDKVFDSNVDTSFHHTEPLSFTVGAGQMIQGFDEGIRLLRPGSKAIIYIPSMQGYGPAGSGTIKGYDHLKFDVDVLKVADKAPAQPTTPGDSGQK